MLLPVVYVITLGCIAHGYIVSETEVLETPELTVSTDACANVELVTREEWGARPPKSVVKMTTPVTVVFIHHTATAACRTLEACKLMTRAIQDYHMRVKGWNDIGYNFLVGQDGRVYEGRSWNAVGAHTVGWNNVAVAFSVIGNYMDHVPDSAAINAIHNMIQCGIDKGELTKNYKLYGHRDVAETSCPGNSFYNLIKNWPDFGPLPPIKPTLTPLICIGL